VWAGLCPVINLADFIIGRSQASLAGLRELCGADRPAAVVPNAVMAAPSTLDVDSPERPPGEPVVVTAIGRLSPEKGLQHLCEAMKLLQDEGAAVRLVLAGDGPLLRPLQERVASWGLRDKFHFTGAFDEIAPIMRATHIVAHPTLNDGRSVSVLEAMAWGKPVVASRIGGVPELIEHGVSGLLVPPADPPALARALKQLALDPAARRRMGQAARRKFLEGEFSQENMVNQTLAIYRQVIQAKESQCAST
jgi:2-deoxystreptamine N-acetyl-D-glucosaminyltransferase/2-deoxystreptamine glucosyltransferase